MASSKIATCSLTRALSPGDARSLTNTHLVDFHLVLLPREADTWQICKARPISCGSSARRSVSGKAGAAPHGSLWWGKLKSGRAGGLPWSWWCKSAPHPAAPCAGGSREEQRAPCLKSLAPGTAVKKNILDVQACASEKTWQTLLYFPRKNRRRNPIPTWSGHVPRTTSTHLPPNLALQEGPQDGI